DYVCPAVYGIRPVMADVLVRRMRRVAGAAGMHVAPQSCTPNILLVLVPDKRTALTQLRREALGMFGDLSAYRISAMIASDSAAAAWPLVEVLGAHGQELSRHGEAL